MDEVISNIKYQISNIHTKNFKIFVSLVCVFYFWFFIFGLIGCGRKETIIQKPTITIWHWMTDREAAFNKLARQYEDLKGAAVRFELYAPSEAYSSKVKAAAQTDTLPDIFGILGEKRDFASFIKSGYIVDLTEEMEKNNGEWKNSLFIKALSVNEFLPDNEFGIKPGIYGVPLDVMNIQMLYNKTLFKKAGLDPDKPPADWNEFIEDIRKLKKAGIQGLVSGFGEIWMLDCLANNYAYNIMGRDKIIATIKGDIPYTDPDWISVLDLFRQMKDEGALVEGTITMINKSAEQFFSNERAAFAFNGSWCVNVYRGMNPDLEYGVFLPPEVSDNFPMQIWGGAGGSFMVNAKSKNKKEAVEFLRWFTDRQQQIFLSKETLNLPSNRGALVDIPAVLAQFADDMDNTVHPNLLPVHEFPLVIEAFDKGIQSIIIGEKTPQEIAQEVQAIKQREIERQKIFLRKKK